MERQKSRVLLVENDRDARRMYSDFLKADGCDVVEAPSGVEALERLTNGEHFDIVVTDIMMARMDGWELLKSIREDLGFDVLRLPVIVVSAHFDSDTLRVDALGRGASAAYTKAEPLARLVHEVRVHTGRLRSKFDDDTNPD